MFMLAFFSSKYYINDNQLVLGGFNFTLYLELVNKITSIMLVIFAI